MAMALLSENTVFWKFCVTIKAKYMLWKICLITLKSAVSNLSAIF